MASVHYYTLAFASRDHEKVSGPWYVLLHDLYYRDHVRFNVNEGHRTEARQAQLVVSQGIYNARTNPHGAAPVSPYAPHIRTGSPYHACDFDNAEGVRRAAARRGVTLTYTVSTESWHLEANAAELHRYFVRNGRRVFAAHAKAQAKRAVAKVKPKAKAKVAPHRIAPHRLAVSRKGLELIARFEGFRSRPYRDAVGVWTIGYGHTHGVSGSTHPVTPEQGLGLLHADVADAERAVRALGVPMTQGEFDAVVSAVFNLGPGILDKGRTLGNALRARRYRAAANALLLYVFASGHKLAGLVRRRAAERRMFLS